MDSPPSLLLTRFCLLLIGLKFYHRSSTKSSFGAELSVNYKSQFIKPTLTFWSNHEMSEGHSDIVVRRKMLYAFQASLIQYFTFCYLLMRPEYSFFQVSHSVESCGTNSFSFFFAFFVNSFFFAVILQTKCHPNWQY